MRSETTTIPPDRNERAPAAVRDGNANDAAGSGASPLASLIGESPRQVAQRARFRHLQDGLPASPSLAMDPTVQRMKFRHDVAEDGSVVDIDEQAEQAEQAEHLSDTEHKPETGQTEEPERKHVEERTDDIVGDEPVKAKGPARPFQIASAQFDAAYDIQHFGQEIAAYKSACAVEGTVPVIEVRYYDALFDAVRDLYRQRIVSHLKPIMAGTRYQLVMTFLRDEAMPPELAVPEDYARDSLQDLSGLMTAWDDLALGGTDKNKYGGKLNAAKPGTMQDALNSPKSKLLATGGLMLPLPEYASLQQNSAATVSKRDASYHHRVLGALIDKAKIKAKDTVLNEDRSMRPRRNSIAAPHTVTYSNLVNGDENESAQLTVDVVTQAFAKGADQVVLIVERKGKNDSDTGRVDEQKRRLQERGFSVEEAPLASDARAQQSGIALDEPGATVPARVKLTVKPPAEQKPQDTTDDKLDQ